MNHLSIISSSSFILFGQTFPFLCLSSNSVTSPVAILSLVWFFYWRYTAVISMGGENRGPLTCLSKGNCIKAPGSPCCAGRYHTNLLLFDCFVPLFKKKKKKASNLRVILIPGDSIMIFQMTNFCMNTYSQY